MKVKSIYINGIFYEYHAAEFTGGYAGAYGFSEKVSFLLDKKYFDVFPTKINDIIYQHGMTIRLAKDNDNDLYWYMISSPVYQIYRPGLYGPYFEIIIKGKREKIEEKIILRNIKLNELLK